MSQRRKLWRDFHYLFRSSFLIFVGHELVGRNHRAIVDAMQLRLMDQYLENNCRSLDDRNDDFLKYQRTNVQTKLDDNTGFRGPSPIDPSLS